jgi:uncharacterized caspase-like protein
VQKSNYNCLLIGINRYDFLQPLNYGMADAQGVQQFIVEEIGCSSSRCVLLTDTSPRVKGRSTYPDRQNILQWLNPSNFQHSRDGLFWLFFSGYGMNYQGEDYLMPIDGNPQDIITTGISLRSLLDSLQQSFSSKILLILDINRSLVGGNTIGDKTIELARERGINLVLSCQPFEFSHEVADLGHGIFTSTLLEALRCHRHQLTLGNLSQYLRDRLPELSEHYWRPIQTPVTITPSLEAAEVPIFPIAEPFRLKWQNFPTVAPLPVNSVSHENIPTAETVSSKTSAAVATLTPVVREKLPPVTAHPTPESNRQLNPLKPSQYLLEKHPWLWWLLLGGSGLLLLGIVVPQILSRSYRPPSQSFPAPISPSPVPTPSPLSSSIPPSPPSSEQPIASQELLETARVKLQFHQASDLHQAINQARKVKPDQPFYLEAQADISRWSQLILDIAQGRAKKENFQGAMAAVSLIPPDDNSVYFLAQRSLEYWRIKSQEKQTNQELIRKAKKLIRSNQASSYSRAILTLNPIAKGSPGYAEAEKLMDKWSKKIYLIAQSRAVKGEYKKAIGTAILVPKDSLYYSAAQSAIAQWKKKVS